MWRYTASLVLLLTGFAEISAAQRAVSPYQRYFRIICLVHLTGAGTETDAVRPEYAPEDAAVATRSGILAWTFQLTDDKQMAIVEYVAADRTAFGNILADARPEILKFEIGKDRPEAIEAALQKYKAGFRLDSMRLPVQ